MGEAIFTIWMDLGIGKTLRERLIREYETKKNGGTVQMSSAFFEFSMGIYISFGPSFDSGTEGGNDFSIRSSRKLFAAKMSEKPNRNQKTLLSSA